jgi:hypothetical protein
LWFCKWRVRWNFPPGHCNNRGQIQRVMEPINACWLLLDTEAWFSKFDVHSAREESPIALGYTKPSIYDIVQVRDDSSKTVFNEAFLLLFSCSAPQFT